MRARLLIAVLLLSGSLCAKDKSLSAYPLNFTVSSTLYDDPSSTDLNHKCRMFLKEDNGTGYSVYSNGLCTTFSPVMSPWAGLLLFWAFA